MARKLGDIISIQLHPAFSLYGQRVLSVLLSCYLSQGLESLWEEIRNIFNPQLGWKKPDQAIIEFDDNKGDSVSNAVIIRMPTTYTALKHLTTNTLGIHAEYWYLCYRYGFIGKDWVPRQQACFEHEGRMYDVLTIKTRQHSSRQFYFEITEFYGKNIEAMILKE